MTTITIPSIPRMSMLRSFRFIGAHVPHAWRTVRLPPCRDASYWRPRGTQRTPSARELILRPPSSLTSVPLSPTSVTSSEATSKLTAGSGEDSPGG